MDREKLKLIVRNLKLLVDSLESEVHSDIEAYKNYDLSSLKIITYGTEPMLKSTLDRRMVSSLHEHTQYVS